MRDGNGKESGLRTFDDGIDGARFLAETTVDALRHVDVWRGNSAPVSGITVHIAYAHHIE